jgi:FtsH-binding integral membrane protein
MAVEQQADFILKTYAHLFGAIAGFVFIEYYLFTNGYAETIARALLGVSWLMVLGGFILVAWLASHAAHTAKSVGVQYLALAGFVAAEAIIFVPMLYMAEAYASGTIENAAIVTLVAFAALTAVVFVTRKNFSFLRPLMMWGGMLAMGMIVFSVLFGSTLGLWFAAAMVVYAGGAVLYDTSKVLHEYRPGQEVAASLQLFASIALLFWYVLMLFMGDD